MSETVPASGGYEPMTDERIEEVFVTEVVPYATKVVIVDYDPTWPDEFAQEAARIRAALGATAVLLEHKGSTAVPGLAAKPIIDILLAVPDSSVEESYVDKLERAGYELVIRESDWHEHRVLRKRVERGDDRDVNLHVFTAGCDEVARDLAFRNRLRANDADRDRYEGVKRQLATQDWKYLQNYADAKSEVIWDILRAAGYLQRPCATH
jgi:GrpB-like predicted nucleotidyltransferase (UPF0157 family)